MWNKIKEKMKSWVVWLSLAALVVYVLKTIFHIDCEEWMDGFLNVLLPLLVAFGVVNNPNSRDSL